MDTEELGTWLVTYAKHLPAEMFNVLSHYPLGVTWAANRKLGQSFCKSFPSRASSKSSASCRNAIKNIARNENKTSNVEIIANTNIEYSKTSKHSNMFYVSMLSYVAFVET